MTYQRMSPAFASGFASLAFTLTTAILFLTSSGCSSGNRVMAPAAPSALEVVGTLIAIKDDRPVDGGVDLTLEISTGVRELARVPSIFRKPPVESVVAMHAVVNATKLGDRLRARGTRDDSGALQVESLEIVSR